MRARTRSFKITYGALGNNIPKLVVEVKGFETIEEAAKYALDTAKHLKEPDRLGVNMGIVSIEEQVPEISPLRDGP